MSVSVRITILSVMALAIVLLVSKPAHAKADPVSKAFKGQIIISDDALPAMDPDAPKDTIRAYKKLKLATIEGNVVDGVATWQFHFTAFMKKKPKTGSLSIEFYTTDKEKLFVADKRLTGADPNVQILASHITISEDENLNRGRTYDMRLIAKVGKKNVVLASTRVSTK